VTRCGVRRLAILVTVFWYGDGGYLLKWLGHLGIVVGICLKNLYHQKCLERIRSWKEKEITVVIKFNKALNSFEMTELREKEISLPLGFSSNEGQKEEFRCISECLSAPLD
jgi:hypothetical protein